MTSGMIEQLVVVVVGSTIGIVIGSYISSYLLRRGITGDLRKFIRKDFSEVLGTIIGREEVQTAIKNVGEFASKGKEFLESEEFKSLIEEVVEALKGLSKQLKVNKNTEKESLLKLPKKPGQDNVVITTNMPQGDIEDEKK